MAMVFSFKMHPFGYQNNPVEFGTMRVHSSGSIHDYTVDVKTKDGWKTVARGGVTKRMPDGTRRSGHRNFLHLLRDILNNMDLDEMEPDYVNVFEDVKLMFPNIDGVADYPEN